MGAQHHHSIIGGAYDVTLEAMHSAIGFTRTVGESIPDLFRPSNIQIVDPPAVVRGLGHAVSYARFVGSVVVERLGIDR